MIRIGKVSAIDYQTGMVRITYPSDDDAVSKLTPVLAVGKEYYPLQIGERVAVLSDGQKEIVLGALWNGSHPAGGSKGESRKELPGAEASCKNGTIKVKAEDIEFSVASGSIKMSQVIEKLGENL